MFIEEGVYYLKNKKILVVREDIYDRQTLQEAIKSKKIYLIKDNEEIKYITTITEFKTLFKEYIESKIQQLQQQKVFIENL